MIEFNGEYGCMGDLGMHALPRAVPRRLAARNVRAVLSNIVTERPDGKGGMAPARHGTTPPCSARCRPTDQHFPMTIRTQRIAPGERTPGSCGSRAPGSRPSSAPSTRRRCELLATTREATGVAGARYRAAGARMPPSPAASSSSASRTPSCRCLPRSATSWCTTEAACSNPSTAQHRKKHTNTISHLPPPRIRQNGSNGGAGYPPVASVESPSARTGA